ncbi:MAG: efflux RND transporter periplasmic adaptor subunit [Salibacteraceae bacterium]
MNKRILTISALAGSVLVFLYFSLSGGDTGDAEIVAEVEKGPFEVRVYTTGELEAKNSVEVKGPRGLRAASIWRVQITNIVDEGTVVKKGEYIASLDRTEMANKLKDANTEVLQSQSQYTQSRLDTAIDLRSARENLANLEYQFREAKITLEQSQYEPPATIRQAEIDLEKSEKSLEEAHDNYSLKVQQAKAKMQEVETSLTIARAKVDQLNSLQNDFEILAPEDGMVIYKRDWNGKRVAVGSEIGAWNPVVATLPDLSVMISKTYVNEVDIRKIERQQEVEVTLDAFPKKKLSGRVIKVANVGEQMKGTDAKVFEVSIEINENDTTLRPSMTTGNNIITTKLDDVVFVPLEAINNQGDTLMFVYQRTGFGLVKKEVRTGIANENYSVIEAGLNPGDQILLSRPLNEEDITIERLEDDKTMATFR